MASALGAGGAVVLGLVGAGPAWATCANKAVFDACMSTESARLAVCLPDDDRCRCDALSYRQSCYLQCTDDIDLVNAGKEEMVLLKEACARARAAGR